MAGKIVASLAALCLLCIAGAAAQTPPAPPPAPPPKPSLDGNNGTFSGFNATQFKFTFALPPKRESRTTGNMVDALRPAGFASRLFALRPCSLFVPHFHPGAAEYFLGIKGQINLVAYINRKLIKNEILADGVDSVIVPINTWHYFYNAQCEPAAVISSLNSGAPGFQGFYDIPKKITDTVATEADVQLVIDTKTPNITIDGTRTFFDLTTNCLRRCDRKRNGKKWNDDDDENDYYYKSGRKHMMG